MENLAHQAVDWHKGGIREVTCMLIETSRMYIRDFHLHDAGDLQEILGDSETMKNCEPAYSFEKTEKFLEEFCIAKRGALAAVLKESQKVIGYILFKPWDKEVYEIGWIFNKKYWRSGYAYESCSAVLEYGFHKMGLHKVVAETMDGVKSVGLMAKLGMKREGVQRSQTRDQAGNWSDLYLYGLLQDEAR